MSACDPWLPFQRKGSEAPELTLFEAVLVRKTWDLRQAFKFGQTTRPVGVLLRKPVEFECSFLTKFKPFSGLFDEVLTFPFFAFSQRRFCFFH